MIQGKLLSYGDDLSEVMDIRRKVFVEELLVPKEIEFDGQDRDAVHVLVYEEAAKDSINNTMNNYKIAVATGRIIYDGESCEIGHISVLKEYRNKKYGDFTVRMLLSRAFTAGINKVTLTANTEVMEFFHKIGFQNNNIKDEKYKKFTMKIRRSEVITPCKSK